MASKRSRVTAAPSATLRTAGGRNGTESSPTKNQQDRRQQRKNWHQLFSDTACGAAHYAGQPIAFLAASFVVIAWAVSGPLFGFSDTWQLVINTSTTIVTFLMVFLIQHTQNRDTLAVQLKLAELIIAMKGGREPAGDSGGSVGEGARKAARRLSPTGRRDASSSQSEARGARARELTARRSTRAHRPTDARPR